MSTCDCGVLKICLPYHRVLNFVLTTLEQSFNFHKNQFLTNLNIGNVDGTTHDDFIVRLKVSWWIMTLFIKLINKVIFSLCYTLVKYLACADRTNSPICPSPLVHRNVDLLKYYSFQGKLPSWFTIFVLGNLYHW